MSKGSARRKEDTAKVHANWDAVFGKKKPSECPKCGSEEYDSCRTPVGAGDPSHTYCVCTSCKHEFDGVTIWD